MGDRGMSMPLRMGKTPGLRRPLEALMPATPRTLTSRRRFLFKTKWGGFCGSMLMVRGCMISVGIGKSV